MAALYQFLNAIRNRVFRRFEPCDKISMILERIVSASSLVKAPKDLQTAGGDSPVRRGNFVVVTRDTLRIIALFGSDSVTEYGA
jgi:hypothetical protein